MGPTVSPVALSKFLTAVSGKQFQNPPSEMLASRGLLIHDLLEMFSGKPMPGRVCPLSLALSRPFLLPFKHFHCCLSEPSLLPFRAPSCCPFVLSDFDKSTQCNAHKPKALKQASQCSSGLLNGLQHADFSSIARLLEAAAMLNVLQMCLECSMAGCCCSRSALLSCRHLVGAQGGVKVPLPCWQGMRTCWRISSPRAPC